MTCSVFWVDRAFHRTWRMVQPCLVQLINLPLSKCNVRLFFGTVIIISYFFKSPWYIGPSVKGLACLSWSLSVFRGNYKTGSQGSWPLWRFLVWLVQSLLNLAKTFNSLLLAFSINLLIPPSYSSYFVGISMIGRKKLRDCQEMTWHGQFVVQIYVYIYAKARNHWWNNSWLQKHLGPACLGIMEVGGH